MITTAKLDIDACGHVHLQLFFQGLVTTSTAILPKKKKKQKKKNSTTMGTNEHLAKIVFSTCNCLLQNLQQNSMSHCMALAVNG